MTFKTLVLAINLDSSKTMPVENGSTSFKKTIRKIMVSEKVSKNQFYFMKRLQNNRNANCDKDLI